MKKLKQKYFFLLIILQSLMLFGCTLLNENTYPKFTVSKPVYKNAESDPTCEIGGVYFNFYNKSKNNIESMEIRMRVFDRTTRQMAFPGIGTIISILECDIQSKEHKKFCISLDSYITIFSNSDYLIDEFYISKIRYSDGSVWEDKYGIYAVSSED